MMNLVGKIGKLVPKSIKVPLTKLYEKRNSKIKLDTILHKNKNKIRGVVHLGACMGEEISIYQKNNISNVILIEGNPYLIPIIKSNISKNERTNRYHLFECVISELDGEEVEFKIIDDGMPIETWKPGGIANPGCSSILDLKKFSEYYPHIRERERIKCKTKTMDSIFIENNLNMGDYNFLVMDIQGGEMLALKGMKKFMKHLDFIYSEVQFEELYAGATLIGEFEHYLKTKGLTRKYLEKMHQSWGDAFYVRG